MKSLLIFLGTLFTTSLSCATTLEKCGVYNVEGYLIRKVQDGKDEMQLIVEKGTEAEVTFNIGSYEEKKYKFYIDTKVNMNILVSKKCMYQCAAQIVEFKKALEPFDNPKPFLFPKPSPLEEMKCTD